VGNTVCPPRGQQLIRIFKVILSPHCYPSILALGEEPRSTAIDGMLLQGAAQMHLKRWFFSGFCEVVVVYSTIEGKIQ